MDVKLIESFNEDIDFAYYNDNFYDHDYFKFTSKMEDIDDYPEWIGNVFLDVRNNIDARSYFVSLVSQYYLEDIDNFIFIHNKNDILDDFSNVFNLISSMKERDIDSNTSIVYGGSKLFVDRIDQILEER